MATPCPPPYDTAAQARAKRIAAAAGKPRTQDKGLRAIHAVLHKAHFKTECRAWETYGASMQRFHEWQKVGVEKLDAAQPALTSAIMPQQNNSAAADTKLPDIWVDVALYHTLQEWYAGRAELPEDWQSGACFVYDDVPTQQPAELSTRPKDQRLLAGPQWLQENTPNLIIHIVGESPAIDESAYRSGEPVRLGSTPPHYHKRVLSDDELPLGVMWDLNICYATFPGGPPGMVHVGSPVLSTDRRHFTRMLSVDAYSPDGSPNVFQPEVLLASLEPCCHVAF